MTEQERPRTEAAARIVDGLEAIRDTSSDSASRQLALSLLALWPVAYDAIEAEGRQQAVREIRAEMDDPANLITSFSAHVEGGYMKAVLKEPLDAILDRVAGLNASESPRPWLTIHGVEQPHRGHGLPDHIPDTYKGRCPECGDASESGQPRCGCSQCEEHDAAYGPALGGQR